MSKDVNVLTLVRGGERWIWVYDDDRKSEVLHTLGRFAADQALSFTWYDAAVVSHKMRQAAAVGGSAAQ